VALKLVVLRALGLGDLLTAVPALRALARAFPDHERILLAPAELEPLVGLMGEAKRPRPAAAAYRVVDTRGRHAPPPALPAAARGADVAANLHGRGPQSTELLHAARPRTLIAFGVQARWHAGEHEVARWCRLLRATGIEADERELDLDPPPGPPPVRAATVVHPGAAAPARRWPADRWAAVARAAPPPVVVTAGPGERELACAVAGDHAAVFAGDLLELAKLVAAADRVLCADTGIAHLATALRTPSVVLFGPTSPVEWGPPPERPQHRVLWTGATGDPGGARPHAGLLALRPHDVLTAIGA
jgi:ADP-heptose:LPS heptosyltransferase